VKHTPGHMQCTEAPPSRELNAHAKPARHGRRLRAAGMVAGAVWGVAFPGLAGATEWRVSSGNWSASANWTAGVPTSSTEAWVMNNGTVAIDSSNAAASVLALGYGTGQNGAATMSSSTASYTGPLYLGFTGGSTGTFTQSAGTVTSGDLRIAAGANVGSELRRYTLNGGTLNASSLQVGSAGTGDLQLKGGTANVQGTWYLGNLNGSRGTLQYDAGNLVVDSTSARLLVGSGSGTGIGTFNATTHVTLSRTSTTDGFRVGTNGSATFGGTTNPGLTLGRGTVAGSNIRVTQTGGSVNVNGYVAVASVGPSGASNAATVSVTGGTWNQNGDAYVGLGGTAQVTVGRTASTVGVWRQKGYMAIGKHASGSANLLLDGGQLFLTPTTSTPTTQLWVGNEGLGTFTIRNNAKVEVNIPGGQPGIIVAQYNNGIMNFESGNVASNNPFVVGMGGNGGYTGQFNQTGGVWDQNEMVYVGAPAGSQRGKGIFKLAGGTFGIRNPSDIDVPRNHFVIGGTGTIASEVEISGGQFRITDLRANTSAIDSGGFQINQNGTFTMTGGELYTDGGIETNSAGLTGIYGVFGNGSSTGPGGWRAGTIHSGNTKMLSPAHFVIGDDNTANGYATLNLLRLQPGAVTQHAFLGGLSIRTDGVLSGSTGATGMWVQDGNGGAGILYHNGRISPGGTQIGTIMVDGRSLDTGVNDGSINFQTNSSLDIQIASATSFDRLSAHTLYYGGVLNVSFLNGYAPSTVTVDIFGSSLHGYRVNNVPSAFAAVNVPAGYTWQMNYALGQLTLTRI